MGGGPGHAYLRGMNCGILDVLRADRTGGRLNRIVHAWRRRRLFEAGLRLLLWIFLSARADVVTQPRQVYGLGDLSAATVSPDQRHLATAGPSAAYLWDFATGTLRHRLQEHGAPVTTLAFSPDSRLLVTGTRFGDIGVWSSEEGLVRRIFAGHRNEITALRFSPDGQRILSSSADNSTALWSVDSGELLRRVAVPGSFVNDAVFTPDGTRFVTADGFPSNAVRLWDPESGLALRQFEGHEGAALALAFLPDGRLATGGEDRTVRLWNLDTGELTRTLEGARGGVEHLAVVSDGPLLLAGSHDQRVLAWDTTTGNALHVWATDHLASLAWVPGTKSALTATSNLRVRVVDLETGLTQRSFEGHTTSVTSGVAFSPDGRHVLSAGVESAIRLWNRTNAAPLRMFEGHGAGSAAAAFSPDGRRVLTTYGHPRMAAQLWNVETGQIEREFRGHTDWLLAAAFSPDGTRIATGAQDRTLRLWETATGRLLHTLATGGASIHCVAFSPDGRLVAGGGSSFDPTVRIWDAASGELRAMFLAEAGTIKALAFSPDSGDLFVAWEEGLIRVLNLASGRQVQELTAGGFLNDLALSPDGALLLVAEGWPTFVARLVDWRTGEVLRVLAGHTAPVESVAFSPSGTQALTGADVVRSWDLSAVHARLRTTRTATGLELHWNLGTLQHAASPHGPWQPLDAARSPWTPPLDLTSGFFRVAVDGDEAADGR